MFRLLAVTLLVAAASATSFDKCVSGPSPLEVRVSGCDTQPCEFKRGKNIVAEVDIAIDHAVSKLTPQVKATSAGITIDYPLPQQDGCKSLTNSECPLAAGEEVTYRLEMPILEAYPLVTVDIQFTLVDQDKKAVECFQITGQVVN
ncbi:NPC intracellular cholesterol transporter 2 [Anabrus simplex]|uniref:NPC intracellular cholesterol transporter 2 n=1 Tax=Anabrus simplex TaxID=316456 RepID=UPI0034DD107B